MLFAVEPGDRLGRGVAAECLAVFVGKGPEERVHPFDGSRLQGRVCNFDQSRRRF